MSDAVLIAFLAALPPTIAAISVLLVALRTGSKINNVRRDLNGRLDQLIEAERRNAAAEAAHRQWERDRESGGDPPPPPARR